MKQNTAILLFIMPLLFASNAHAQFEDLSDRGASRQSAFSTNAIPEKLSLGLAGFYKSGLYVDRDDTFIPVPLVYYRNDDLLIYVQQASYAIYKLGILEVAAVAELRLDGYQEDDSDFLKGMDDRWYSVDAGLSAELDTPIGDVVLEGISDILFQHQGQEVKLSYEVPLILEDWYIKPIVTGRWKSQNLANYYYGVRADEATALRPEYVVDDVFGYSAALAINYRIAEDWLAIFLGEYQRFADDIHDSPIVEDSGQLKGFLGVGWVF